MRVLLMPRHRVEDGAVAIMVALVVVSLALLSAFAVDFGLAYNSKRQLQTGADAAALAGASVYAAYVDTCDASVITAHQAEAQLEAQGYVDDNVSSIQQGVTMDHFGAHCVDGELLVDVELSGDTDAVFGGLTGTGPTLTTARQATAAVDVPPGGGGLRPLAICGSELPADIQAGDAWKIHAPGNGHVPPEGCPIPPNAGNWWTLDCPGERPGGGGTNGIIVQIREGCTDPITIVPGQGSLSGAALNSHLAAACPGESVSAPYQCLSGDPGQPDAGHSEDAWQHLIDEGIRVSLPVFCAPSKCATSSVTGTGTNAVFPVHRLVSATVCGYHFGKQNNKKYVRAVPTADCAGLAVEMAALMADDSDMAYLLLTFQRLQVSGDTTAFDCELGDDECDGGLRRLRLVN